MSNPKWLTPDVLPVIAGMLDFKSYILLMSTCNTAFDCMSPNTAPTIYPAVEHIKLLIHKYREHLDQNDSCLFQRVIGNVRVYTTIPNHRREWIKSYFHTQTNGWTQTRPTTVSIIVNRNVFRGLREGGEINAQLDSVRACITPSKEQPLWEGVIEVVTSRSDKDGQMVAETKTIVYTDGINNILHELVYNVCRLEFTPPN
jgi:hypothetical protein